MKGYQYIGPFELLQGELTVLQNFVKRATRVPHERGELAEQ